MVQSISDALDHARAPKHVRLRAEVLDEVVQCLVSVCMCTREFCASFLHLRANVRVFADNCVFFCRRALAKAKAKLAFFLACSSCAVTTSPKRS